MKILSRLKIQAEDDEWFNSLTITLKSILILSMLKIALNQILKKKSKNQKIKSTKPQFLQKEVEGMKENG